MDYDTPQLIRHAHLAERETVRKWVYRINMFILAIGGLLLEAFAIFEGGAVARIISPGFIGSGQIGLLAVACLILAVIICAIRCMDLRSGSFAAWSVWFSLLVGLAITRDHTPRDLEAFGAWFVITTGAVVLIHGLHRWVVRNVVAAITVPRNVAFLGNSPSAARMLAQLKGERYPQIRAIGFFDDRAERPGPLTNVLPWLGTLDGVIDYIHDTALSEVYIALPWSAGSRISTLVERLRFLPLTVRLVPDSVPAALTGRSDGRLTEVVMPTLMVPPFSTIGGIFKRTVDTVGSLILLVPLVPVFLVVALLIKCDSNGPIFFRQVRSGRYGRPFRIFKFRTLHVAQQDTAAETLVVAGDRRVTRIGRYLRKYSIDELPQILNVLLGQMSLVGPRPHAPRAKADGRIYAEVIPEYMLRYRVKPGMTGWAQVNGWRGNTDTEEQLRRRVEYDFQYIGRWSLRKDIEIVLRTIPAMLMPPAHNS